MPKRRFGTGEQNPYPAAHRTACRKYSRVDAVSANQAYQPPVTPRDHFQGRCSATSSNVPPESFPRLPETPSRGRRGFRRFLSIRIGRTRRIQIHPAEQNEGALQQMGGDPDPARDGDQEQADLNFLPRLGVWQGLDLAANLGELFLGLFLLFLGLFRLGQGLLAGDKFFPSTLASYMAGPPSTSKRSTVSLVLASAVWAATISGPSRGPARSCPDHPRGRAPA